MRRRVVIAVSLVALLAVGGLGYLAAVLFLPIRETPDPNTAIVNTVVVDTTVTLAPASTLLARCGSRGAPVTLAKLVKVARANGITLSIDRRGCKELERIQTSADATNAGPSGLERRPSVYLREGHVLCTVVRVPHARNREVVVVKYPTDTETQVGVLNVGCAVYPSDAASEQMQVNRLRKALEAVARMT
jgi:hypothetical protein